MKRKREEESCQTNHLFKTIYQQPDILTCIFIHLDVTELLSFYRVLYRYAEDPDRCIITVMENHVMDKYKTEMYLVNRHFYSRKMQKYSSTTPGNYNKLPQDHIKSLIKYQEFRWTRNFVKYGTCIMCNKLPYEPGGIYSDHEFLNYNKRELEYAVGYRCIPCSATKEWFLTRIEDLEDIGNNIIKSFMETNNVRYIDERGYKQFLLSDVNKVRRKYSWNVKTTNTNKGK